MGACHCGGTGPRFTAVAMPDSVEEWEALGGAAAAKCLEHLARLASRDRGKKATERKVILKHAFIGPEDTEEVGRPTKEQAEAEAARVARWHRQHGQGGAAVAGHQPAASQAGFTADAAAASRAPAQPRAPPPPTGEMGPPVVRRVVLETVPSIKELAQAVRKYSPSAGTWACPQKRHWAALAAQDAATAGEARAAPSAGHGPSAVQPAAGAAGSAGAAGAAGAAASPGHDDGLEAPSFHGASRQWRKAMLEARAARSRGVQPPLSSAMQRGIVRRAISLLLANHSILAKTGPPLGRPVDLSTAPTLLPAMPPRRVAAMLRTFRAMKRGTPHGELTVFELDIFTTRNNDTVSDSVFMPLLFRLVRARKGASLSPMEFVAWLEVLCILTQRELAQWAFQQLATMRPGATGRTGLDDPLRALPTAIVLPALVTTFREFRDCDLRPGDPNLPLLKELQARARHNQLGHGHATGRHAAVFARLQELDIAGLLGVERSAELLFEDDFLAACDASQQCLFPLNYIRDEVRNSIFTEGWWGRRRAAVLEWASRHRAVVADVIHGRDASRGEHGGLSPINGGWDARLHSPSLPILMRDITARRPAVTPGLAALANPDAGAGDEELPTPMDGPHTEQQPQRERQGRAGERGAGAGSGSGSADESVLPGTGLDVPPLRPPSPQTSDNGAGVGGGDMSSSRSSARGPHGLASSNASPLTAGVEGAELAWAMDHDADVTSAAGSRVSSTGGRSGVESVSGSNKSSARGSPARGIVRGHRTSDGDKARGEKDVSALAQATLKRAKLARRQAARGAAPHKPKVHHSPAKAGKDRKIHPESPDIR